MWNDITSMKIYIIHGRSLFPLYQTYIIIDHNFECAPTYSSISHNHHNIIMKRYFVIWNNALKDWNIHHSYSKKLMCEKVGGFLKFCLEILGKSGKSTPAKFGQPWIQCYLAHKSKNLGLHRKWLCWLKIT